MIGFGLVNIPIQLFAAVREHRLKFHFLHRDDNGRIKNQRICQKCGKAVSYAELARGFEYSKGKHVVLSEKELEKVDMDPGRRIAITEFVDANEVDPMLFETPYFVGPVKGSEKPWALLREALERGQKIGIGKMVFRAREHLVGLKASAESLVLERMHFADEISKPIHVEIQAKLAAVNKKELELADQLIHQMTQRFDPAKYKDEYQERLTAMIQRKLTGKGASFKRAPMESTNVVDLMTKLKASLQKTKAEQGRRRTRAAA
jgi:DNA end-binding protein Ku